MPRSKKKTVKLSSLIPDDKNFNKGTDLGSAMLKKSMNKFGTTRSIVIDKNNKIIAGNKSADTAGALGIDNVQIIESDGKTLFAIRRNDIDLDTPEGREMALADNIAAKENIIIDAELVEAELGEVVMEEYHMIDSDEESGGGAAKSMKENLLPFKRTHVLLSFHPQLLLKLQAHLQAITEIEGVEYEQSSN